MKTEFHIALFGLLLVVLPPSISAQRVPVGIVPGVALPKRATKDLSAEAKANADAARAVLQRNNVAAVSSPDMVAEGIVTVSSGNDSKSFPFTVVRNGESQAQRIFLTQPDGKTWDGNVMHLAPGAARALDLIETQNARGLSHLLNAPKRGAEVKEAGTRDSANGLTVQESTGESTQYFVDSATSQVMRMEFSKTPTAPLESYAFSDFRTPGVPSAAGAAPFKVEHFTGGIKQGELQFSKIQYIEKR